LLLSRGCGLIDVLCFGCIWQIRSLRAPYPLIQTVVLRNVRHLCQSNDSTILALDNSIHGLFPVPLGAQVLLILLNDWCLFCCGTCFWTLMQMAEQWITSLLFAFHYQILYLILCSVVKIKSEVKDFYIYLADSPINCFWQLWGGLVIVQASSTWRFKSSCCKGGFNSYKVICHYEILPFEKTKE